jgi:hypothetical protein
MKKSTLFTASLTISLLSGCASILNEQTQPINVTSSTGNPITGSIDGVAFKAPGIVNVTRSDKDKVVKVDTEGCQKETLAPKSVDSKFYINILSGGVFGSSTDYSTEKMWKYQENIVVSCTK